MDRETILVLDFGSQYGQLIARRLREMDIHSEIVGHDISAEDIRARKARALILSGGPASVYEDDAPQLSAGVIDLELPVLGICYGLHALADALGGKIDASPAREFGRTELTVTDEACPLFAGLPHTQTVWMSHGDRIEDIHGAGLHVAAKCPASPVAAFAHESRPLFGVQFHPEVHHSEHGGDVLRNFAYRVAGCRGTWKMASFIDESVEKIRAQVGDADIVCGLSGGVDSSVAAALIAKAVPDQLHCIFVDNGLLRQGEVDEVASAFRAAFPALDLRVIDAGELFLKNLAGVTDPETKRKRIGHDFIEVFREAAAEIRDAKFLAQGTLYPDVIESRSPRGGPSATIKTHHNVGGLPEELGFELVEPLRELFKDEVRRVGAELGLPDNLTQRQPFPGPGLAVRCLGEVTAERLAILRQADAIVTEEIRHADLYHKIWQSLAVLLPVATVGVMGDQRTYESACAIRAVESTDGMTADWFRMPYDVLERMANRIVNEVRGINRVAYDISSKPPATIEWE